MGLVDQVGPGPYIQSTNGSVMHYQGRTDRGRNRGSEVGLMGVELSGGLCGGLE